MYIFHLCIAQDDPSPEEEWVDVSAAVEDTPANSVSAASTELHETILPAPDNINDAVVVQDAAVATCSDN